MLLNVSIHLQCESWMEKVFFPFFFQKLSIQKLFYYLTARTDFSHFMKNNLLLSSTTLLFNPFRLLTDLQVIQMCARITPESQSFMKGLCHTFLCLLLLKKIEKIITSVWELLPLLKSEFCCEILVIPSAGLPVCRVVRSDWQTPSGWVSFLLLQDEILELLQAENVRFQHLPLSSGLHQGNALVEEEGCGRLAALIGRQGVSAVSPSSGNAVVWTVIACGRCSDMES